MPIKLAILGVDIVHCIFRHTQFNQNSRCGQLLSVAGFSIPCGSHCAPCLRRDEGGPAGQP